MAHMHLAVFSTAMQRGYRLIGIEKKGCVERTLDAKERFPLRGRELHAHGIDFFNANAMLAGDSAADLHAQFQNLGTEFFSAIKFARCVGIKQDQRMQIAIAGMENIRTAKFVFFLHLGDTQQDLRQMLARYRAIHAVIVRRDTPCRWKSVLAA